MIEIKIDLVPLGIYDPEQIGKINIYNDGTGTNEVGNYKYILDDGTCKIQGELKGHERAKSVFHLLKDVLNKSI